MFFYEVRLLDEFLREALDFQVFQLLVPLLQLHLFEGHH